MIDSAIQRRVDAMFAKREPNIDHKLTTTTRQQDAEFRSKTPKGMVAKCNVCYDFGTLREETLSSSYYIPCDCEAGRKWDKEIQDAKKRKFDELRDYYRKIERIQEHLAYREFLFSSESQLDGYSLGHPDEHCNF